MLFRVDRGVDFQNRLRLLLSSLEDLGVDEDVMRRIICQQKARLFHSEPAEFSENLHRFQNLLLIFKRSKAKLGGWLVQMRPSSQVNCEETLEYLIRASGSEAAARQMIQRFPLILQFDVEKHLKPGLNLVMDPEQQASRMIARYPRILSAVRRDRFNSMLLLLRNTGLSDEEISKMFTTFPALCTTSIDSLSNRLEFYMSCGVGRDKLRQVLRENPSLVSFNVETGLRPKVQLLNSIGIEEKYVVNILLLHSAVLARSRDALQARFGHLVERAFTREESSELLKKHPSIFNLRHQVLVQKLDFYTWVMKNSLSSMLKVPSYLTYSLELRIKPRIKI